MSVAVTRARGRSCASANAIAPEPVPRSSTRRSRSAGNRASAASTSVSVSGRGTEHGRRHAQRESPEFARPGQIGDRLAVTAALRQPEERVRLLARQRRLRMRDEPTAVAAEHVRKHDLRIDRNESALHERPADGHRIHQCGERSATNTRSRLS
jgi:hypothetical protein